MERHFFGTVTILFKEIVRLVILAHVMCSDNLRSMYFLKDLLYYILAH